ncbi:MAG: gliding motility-associated C-terminal domain-containing protein [Saprospiraceae bacterium]|nr:gliding motility-associated C-terminal domain-containing protein [Saprospiraceae bacterium]
MKHMFDYLMNNGAKALQMLTLALLLLLGNELWAEGSKDFVSYGGYRLFLDNRNEQQLKVYANAGETINVGASHVGIANGFIKVYRPDGTLAATFDGTGGGNTAIIYNNVQEVNGPIGGANGYTPGTVTVGSGQNGIWTVEIAFPVYQASNFINILNSQPWDRATHQPIVPTVITAWDITVSSGGAANAGGSMKTGRVYSNEYVSVISQNGSMTSPEFFVLTKGGFLYQVKFMETDPYRFPITSVSRGMVDSAGQPTYKSLKRDDVTRSADPLSWVIGEYYYYEPQAEDYLPRNFINNKIFFNEPDPAMPSTAMVTDVFRNNTHTTWLFNLPSATQPELENFEIHAVAPNGNPCMPGSLQAGDAATIDFTSTQGGIAYLSFDLNNDGDYVDLVDRTIIKDVAAGPNFIHWDGKNGLGQPLTANFSFTFGYRLELRDGETHILLSDIENNVGGVHIKLLSNVQASSFDKFFYDHTLVDGPVSGNNPNGQPAPTNVPFVYQQNFGDNKILDYWTFVQYSGAAFGTFVVDIVPNCLTPPIPDLDGDGVNDNVDIDDDNDGVPDRKEFCNPQGGFNCLPGARDPSGDADADGIQNYRDANDPAIPNNCTDANADGICDNLNPAYDIDGDRVPDHLDLDSDNDGITDLFEAGHNQPDLNGDGVIDGLPSAFGLNGLYSAIASDPNDPNAVETYARLEWDNDGVPDHDDIDADNDGINDIAEAGYGNADADNNGRFGSTSSPAVVNSKGLANVIDPAITGQPIPLPPDRDGDGIRNWHDHDSDNDLIHDVEEGGNPDGDNNAIIGTGTPVVDTNGKAIAGANGQSLGTTSAPSNKDGDSRPDYLDHDTDNDGINDVVEADGTDPDNNGMPATGMPTVNSKGIPTSVNNTPTSAPADTDSDGVRDYRDLDSDNDGLNDVAEATRPDGDNDGIIGTGTPTVDANGRATTDPTGANLSTTSAPQNTDNDPQPDYRDLDTDADGVWDVTEASKPDQDHDGILGTGIPTVNANGQANAPNLTPTSTPPNTDGQGEPDFRDLDADNDGIPDMDECPVDAPCVDGDSDGSPDFRDFDRDNDGIDDAYECETSTPCTDTDGDGTSDVDDLDTDDDGLADELECPAGNPCPDTDNDGVPDWRDYTCNPSTTVATISNLSAPATVCVGENVSLTANNPTPLQGDVTYTWTGPNGFIFQAAAPAQGPFPVALGNLSNAMAGNYVLTVFTDRGCPSQPASVAVTVTTTPSTPVLTISDLDPCNGEDVTLSTAVQNGPNLEYLWYFGNILLTTTTTPSFQLDNVTLSNNGSYSVQVRRGTCESAISPAATLNVVNVQNTAPTLSVTSNVVCQGAILGLAATGIPTGATYQWFFNNGATVTPLGTTTVPAFTIFNIAPSNTGNYSVVAQVGGCTSPPSNVETVTVGASISQTPIITANDNTPCVGSQLQLSATAYPGVSVNYEWYFDNGSTTINLGSTTMPTFAINNVSSAYDGSYFVSVGTTGCATQASGLTNVTVSTAAAQAPTISVTNGTICQTQAIILNTPSAGTGAQYQWFFNGSSIGTSSTPNFSVPNATTANSGGYSVGVSVGGCTSPQSVPQQVMVTNVLSQTPSITANANNLCEGETLQLVSSNISGATYEWFYNPTGSNNPVSLGTTQTPIFTIANATTLNSGTYTVQAQVSGCISQPSGGQQVTVFNQAGTAPSLSVSGNVLCLGESLTLSTSQLPGNNVQYQWYFNGNLIGTTAVPTLQLPNITAANSGSYSVVTGNGNCLSAGSNTETVTVTTNIGPAPSLTVVNDVLCQGETLELNSTFFPSNNVSYNWYFNPTGASNATVLLGTTNNPTFYVQGVDANDAGFYTVVANVGNCSTQPSNAQDISVTNAISGAPTLTASAQQICEGETLALNSSIYPGTNIQYQWYFNNGITNTLLGATNSPTFFLPNIANGNEGTYTVVVAAGNCTTQPSNAAAVEVTNALSGIPPTLTTTSTQLCMGETLTLNSSAWPNAGASYLWYFDNGNGQVLLGISDVPTWFVGDVTMDDVGTYTVVVASGSCTTQPSNAELVLVASMSGTAMQLTANDNQLCEGQQLTLNSSAAPNVDMQYQWYFDAGNGPVLLGTTAEPTYFVGDASIGNVGIYSVIASNGECATPPSNLELVTLTESPALLTSSSTDISTPACRGDLVQLNVSPVDGATYQWNGPQGFTANVPNPILPSATPGQAGEYVATLMVDGCIFEAPAAEVHVFTGIAAADDVYDLNFNETLSDADVVVNDLPGNVQAWDLRIVEAPANGKAELVNGKLTYTPRNNFFGPDVMVYEICNSDCPDDCDRATVRFNVLGTDENQDCFAPNIITPNGDGINDNFEVPCLETSYKDNNVRIFNRWGDKVFDKDGYANDWDGRYKGNSLPPGTYFYLIQTEKGKSEKCLQGYFTITR